MDAWSPEDVAAAIAHLEAIEAYLANLREFALWLVAVVLCSVGYRLGAHFFSSAPSRRMYGGRL